MNKYNKANSLKCFFAFAGYDSQAMSLDKLKEQFPNFDYICVGWSEIDKYAIQAHNAVYPQYADKNLGDISKIEWEKVEDFDLFTYSFPCQDISNAGVQRGLAEGSGTRSSLLWECTKAIESKKPKYLLMENVKALTSKKFLPYLKKWEEYLKGLGYSNYTRVLNAKSFGVPQNRERVFMVSILGDEGYEFPKEFPLEKKLNDILEENVDEKYYLKDYQVKTIIEHCRKKQEQKCGFSTNFKTADASYATCITNGYGRFQTDTYIKEPKCIGYTRDSKGRVVGRHLQDTCNTIHTMTGSGWTTDCFVAEPKIIQVGNIVEEKGFKNPQRGRIYSSNGISPALNCCEGGGLQPKIIEPSVINPLKGKSGRSWQFEQQVYGENGITRALKSAQGSGNIPKVLEKKVSISSDFRIRKLTPRECFRLMGVSEENIDKIQASEISNSQQYKMAGNSIVVDVLYYIFKELFYGERKRKEPEQLSLF